MRPILACAFSAALVACATPGTKPSDMSAEGHEAAAVGWTAGVSDPSRAGVAPEVAAAHRAAAQALRDAEARSCQGLAAADRDTSPFEHSPDIEGAAPLYSRFASSKSGAQRKQIGATVRFRAVRGLTREWLQRIIDCHLARNSALGNVASEMAVCPLVLKGVHAEVRSAGAGFEVDMNSEEPGVSDQILARAQRLVIAP